MAPSVLLLQVACLPLSVSWCHSLFVSCLSFGRFVSLHVVEPLHIRLVSVFRHACISLRRGIALDLSYLSLAMCSSLCVVKSLLISVLYISRFACICLLWILVLSMSVCTSFKCVTDATSLAHLSSTVQKSVHLSLPCLRLFLA